MIENKLRCLLVEPYRLPEVIEINNTLEDKQKIVGGYIECAYLPNDEEVVIICNEEGKINGLQLNRDIGHDIIAGPFLIVGDDYENGDFKSLTDEQIMKYKIKFGKNSILQTENKINSIIVNKALNKFDREER
jgi:hypothetical protein